MPPPLRYLAAAARLGDNALAQRVQVADGYSSRRDLLYGLLRREQSVVASGRASRPEVSRILDLAQAAYGDLVGVMVGRDDAVLDSL